MFLKRSFISSTLGLMIFLLMQILCFSDILFRFGILKEESSVVGEELFIFPNTSNSENVIIVYLEINDFIGVIVGFKDIINDRLFFATITNVCGKEGVAVHVHKVISLYDAI